MDGIYNIMMGDRGRIIIPAEVREKADLTRRSPLVLMDCPDGLILLTHKQLLTRVREDLQIPCPPPETLAVAHTCA